MTAVLSEKAKSQFRSRCGKSSVWLPVLCWNFKRSMEKLVASKKVAHDVFTKGRGKGDLPKGLSVDRYLKQPAMLTAVNSSVLLDVLH